MATASRFPVPPYSAGPTVFLDANLAAPQTSNAAGSLLSAQETSRPPCAITVLVPLHELFDYSPDTSVITYLVSRDNPAGCAEYHVRAGSMLATLPSVARMLTRQTASTITLPPQSVDPVKMKFRYTVNGISGFSFAVNMTSLAITGGAQPVSTWLALVADACTRGRTRTDELPWHQQDPGGVSHALVHGIHTLINSAAFQGQVVRSLASVPGAMAALGTQPGVYDLRVADLIGIPFVFNIGIHGIKFTAAEGSVMTLETPVPLRLVVANRACFSDGNVGNNEAAAVDARVIWPHYNVSTPLAVLTPRSPGFIFTKRFVCLPAHIKDRHVNSLICACEHMVTIRINDREIYSADPVVRYQELDEVGMDGTYPVLGTRTVVLQDPLPLIVGENVIEVRVTMISDEFAAGLSVAAYNLAGQRTLVTDPSWLWTHLPM